MLNFKKAKDIPYPRCMNLEVFRNFCLSLPGVYEKTPFNETTLVFYVGSKMFALTDMDIFSAVNLKADPEIAVQLREAFPSVKPGYHMNKKHWITVEMDGSIPDKLILEWVKHSYDLVFDTLTNREKQEIQ